MSFFGIFGLEIKKSIVILGINILELVKNEF